MIKETRVLYIALVITVGLLVGSHVRYLQSTERFTSYDYLEFQLEELTMDYTELERECNK